MTVYPQLLAHISMGFAAAALYYVAKLKNLKHSQRVLSMAAGITEVTIRNRVDDLRGFDQARCGKGGNSSW